MSRPSSSRGLKLLNGLLLLLLLLLLTLSGASLVSYLLQPNAYRFGTEVGSWLYDTRTHFLSGLLTELLVLTGGLVWSLLAHSPARALAIRTSAVLLDAAFLLSTTRPE
jgi:hypothetical protein